MKTWLARVSVGVGSTALSACAGPRMVAPADVAQGSQVLEVADRSSMSGSLVNESFKLGSFQVTDVDRDWNKKSGFAVGGYSSDTTTTGYSFNLKTGAETWSGSCASAAKKQGVAVLGGEAAWGSSRITCECKSGARTAAVVLNADSPDSPKSLSGELRVDDAKYTASVVNDTDKSSLSGSPAGFRYDGPQGSVGAVEILRPGRVWLNERLAEAERAPVACVSAGLMLYQAPSDH